MQLPTSGLVQSRQTACSLLSLEQFAQHRSIRDREIMRRTATMDFKPSEEKCFQDVPTAQKSDNNMFDTFGGKKPTLAQNGPVFFRRVSVCRVLRASLPLLDMRPTQSSCARSGDRKYLAISFVSCVNGDFRYLCKGYFYGNIPRKYGLKSGTAGSC